MVVVLAVEKLWAVRVREVLVGEGKGEGRQNTHWPYNNKPRDPWSRRGTMPSKDPES